MNSDFIVTTTDVVQGAESVQYLEVININQVIGVNIFADIFASITDFFGGKSETYQRKLKKMYEEVQAQMIVEAKAKGANAIVGYSVEFDEISGGDKSMLMLTATATACVVKF